jgi:hypothetical protein
MDWLVPFGGSNRSYAIEKDPMKATDLGVSVVPSAPRILIDRSRRGIPAARIVDASEEVDVDR